MNQSEDMRRLVDENKDQLHKPAENSQLGNEAVQLFSELTKVMDSKAFSELIRASAKTAANFYFELIDNDVPKEVAGNMAASYCQNLSQTK